MTVISTLATNRDELVRVADLLSLTAFKERRHDAISYEFGVQVLDAIAKHGELLGQLLRQHAAAPPRAWAGEDPTKPEIEA